MPRLPVRVLTLLAAVVLGCVGVAVHPQRAAACSCRGISTSTAFRQADVVFVGRVTELIEVSRPRPGRTDIRFEVERVLKGTAYRQQLVSSPRDRAECGLSPTVGSNWVIFGVLSVEGDGDDAVNRIRSTVCSGNLPGRTAPRTLGPGRPPVAGASDREEKAQRTDAVVDRWLGVVAVGVLVLVVLSGAVIALAWRRSPQG